MNKRRLGAEEEDRAVSYLEGLGYTILERNFRCSAGEIDIIYMDNDDPSVCFCEVKYRRGLNNGFPEEAVNRNKQRIISRVSRHYMAKKGLDESFSFRYDVIAVMPDEIRFIKNAFEFTA